MLIPEVWLYSWAAEGSLHYKMHVLNLLGLAHHMLGHHQSLQETFQHTVVHLVAAHSQASPMEGNRTSRPW